MPSTNRQTTMLIYALMFSGSGCLVDGEEYINLEDARDVAKQTVQETGLDVTICKEHGVFGKAIEVVFA